VERTLELATASPEDTREVGEAVGGLLLPGDLVSLTGDLGAGKTTFVQGAAHALRVQGPVLSPTFTLVREYAGSPTVYHLDVYRLDSLQEVLDLGFDEMLDQKGVVFIEWGDAIEALLPDSYVRVELSLAEDDGSSGPEGPRRLVLSGQGPAWGERWDRLAQAVAPWRS
jgi:tRNA threonylcarbamoyladenosine biosynthesis protein TsaE